MISDDKFNLRPIWDATLEIYKAVVTICKRHNLRHYVTDGTLIGAIRHKGFIPWDDDFDMSMPRPDYEKFIMYAKDELPSHLKFVNWKNTPEFHLLFGKVQDCRREVIENLERESGITMSNGLFLDIFPIDGYPIGRMKVLFIKTVNWFLVQAMNYRFPQKKEHSFKGRLVHPLRACIAILFSPCLREYSDFLSVYEQLLLIDPFETAEFTGRASLCLHELNRLPLAKSAWGVGQKVEFHNTRVTIPSDYDAYLRPIYGDYMELPPKEVQHPTHDYGAHCPWWLGPTSKQ